MRLFKRIMAFFCMGALYGHAIYVFHSTISFTAGAIITLVFQMILYIVVFVKNDQSLQITSKLLSVGIEISKYVIIVFEVAAYFCSDDPKNDSANNVLDLIITICSILCIEMLLRAIYDLKE